MIPPLMKLMPIPLAAWSLLVSVWAEDGTPVPSEPGQQVSIPGPIADGLPAPAGRLPEDPQVQARMAALGESHQDAARLSGPIVADVVASNVSGVGEAMAAGSLAVSGLTGGVGPNVGPIIKGIRKLFKAANETAEVAADTSKAVIHTVEKSAEISGDTARSIEEATDQVVKGSVQPYEVGTADALWARSVKGDNLDVHHAGQAHPMEQLVPGYDRTSGPTIAIPRGEHVTIPTVKGAVSGSPGSQLAKDICDLRNNTNDSNGSLQRLNNINNNMYPQYFNK